MSQNYISTISNYLEIRLFFLTKLNYFDIYTCTYSNFSTLILFISGEVEKRLTKLRLQSKSNHYYFTFSSIMKISTSTLYVTKTYAKRSTISN